MKHIAALLPSASFSVQSQEVPPWHSSPARTLDSQQLQRQRLIQRPTYRPWQHYGLNTLPGQPLTITLHTNNLNTRMQVLRDGDSSPLCESSASQSFCHFSGRAQCGLSDSGLFAARCRTTWGAVTVFTVHRARSLATRMPYIYEPPLHTQPERP